MMTNNIVSLQTRARQKRLPRADPYANVPRKTPSLPARGSGSPRPMTAVSIALPVTPVDAGKQKAKQISRRQLLGTREKELLLAGLIRDPAVFKAAAPHLKSEQFGTLDLRYAICCTLATKHVSVTGCLPNKAALVAAVEDAVTANPSLLNEAERDQTRDFIDWAFEQQSEAWAQWPRMLRWFLEERLASRLAEVLKPAESQMVPADISALFDQFNTEISQVAQIGANGQPMSLAQALEEDPDPQYAQEVISGYLRQGELMNLIAAPKVGKSWLSLSLAIAIASGKTWCGRTVRRGRVLVIDGELPQSVLMSRAQGIMSAMGVTTEDVKGRLDFLAARGMTLSVRDIAAYAAANSYDVVVLDPLYRILRAGQTEIDDAAMRELYDGLLKITASTGCALVVVHHLPKGDAWKRTNVDSGAGSNVSARSADTHVVFRWADDRNGDAATDGVLTLTASCRTFPPPEPLHLRRRIGDVPILVPVDLKHDRAETQPEGRDLHEAMAFASRCAKPDPETKIEILARADTMSDCRGKKLSRRRAEILFAKCITAGYIVKGTNKRYHRPATPAEKISSNLSSALEKAAGDEKPAVTAERARSKAGRAPTATECDLVQI